MAEKMKIEFSDNVTEGLEKLIAASEMACTAFEMLRPENHGQTSDAELAALLNGADKAMHEAMDMLAGRRALDESGHER